MVMTRSTATPIHFRRSNDMWYFAWILGLSLAVLLAVVTTMMLDARENGAGQGGGQS